MKIPTLLVKYLYKYRTLSLTGLGILTLDKSVVIPDENSREPASLANGIEFKSIAVRTPDPALIDYICAETGKIKPLALADLDSYLTLGSEMLNIGKPFYIEGIGTLTRRKDGRCDFIPGEFAMIRESAEGTRVEKIKKRRPLAGEDVREDPNNNRKLIVGAAIVVALAVIGLGGYQMYKKTAPAAEPAATIVATPVDTPQIKADTAKAVTVKDSVIVKKPDTTVQRAVAGDSVNYHFVILATQDKEHALKRYNQILGMKRKIHMSTADSLSFTLYFKVLASPRDTPHIKDSLEREYGHHVSIEH